MSRARRRFSCAARIARETPRWPSPKPGQSDARPAKGMITLALGHTGPKIVVMVWTGAAYSRAVHKSVIPAEANPTSRRSWIALCTSTWNLLAASAMSADCTPPGGR